MTRLGQSFTGTFSSGVHRIFEYSVRALIVFLPFSAFISVWLTYGLRIPGASFIKEFLLAIAIITLLVLYLTEWIRTKKIKIRITYIDWLILAYVLVGIVVTLTTTGMRGLVYGGRYDYEFLVMFLVAYHGCAFLVKPVSYYIKLFLYSGGVMLFLSGLLKWPLTEDLLLYFGYGGNPSAWDFGGAPPIFHGVDGANVRRFQGLLDGPNTMGAFLIVFSGIFAYFLRYKKDWYFVIGLILLGFIGMIFYTYSRSALIGIVVAYMIVLLTTMRVLYRLYRSQLIAVILLAILGLGIVGVGYYDRAMAIIGRAGSTKGHIERMINGVNRVKNHPFGEGLGSSGPAYRHVMELQGGDRQQIEEQDRYYIPESWYIQQFVESGVIGGLLFIILMGALFIELLVLHPILGGMFAGVGVMNFFLHTFESSVFSLTLFLIIGLLLGYKHLKKVH